MTVNVNDIKGMSMSVNASELFLNIYVTFDSNNKDASLKYLIGDKEFFVSFSDASFGGVISIPLSREAIQEDIFIYYMLDGEERKCIFSFEQYGDEILSGEYDVETKGVVRALAAYAGFTDEKIPDGFFDGYENILSDNSDGISYVETEISLEKYAIAKISFTIVGNASFTANKPIKVEKDGLHSIVEVENISLYELDKPINLKADGFDFQFTIFGFAKNLDEETQKEVYFAFAYGCALNEYRKIK